VSASIHLIHLRARDVPRAIVRLRRTLARAPGLVDGRPLLLASLDTVTGGTPYLTRIGAFCGWEDDAARDAFCRHGAPVMTRGARESCSVALEPVRVVKGGLGRWNPSTEGVRKLERGEPLAVITWGRMRMRHMARFTVDNRRIVRDMTGGPGLRMMVGLGDHPMTRATFSLWESQGDVVRFAYGHDAIHTPIQRTALDAPWARDWFFARFRPVASSRTWGGRDPLAASGG
jgi:hypothetical protein